VSATIHNGIRLVCFDLGGVLIRICRSWEEGCERAGLPVRGMERRAATVRERHDIVVAYQTGRIDCDTFAQAVSDVLEGAYSPEEVLAVHRAWILGDYEGVGDVIDSIHHAGLDTACLSNTNHSHWRQIEHSHATMKLRTRLASHLLRLHKPDPAIFAAAERRLKTSGSAILYFDDLEENVAAAREAGWNAVEVDPLARTDEQIARALRMHGIEHHLRSR
jgi:putative hydrolase of the HAD superfamily